MREIKFRAWDKRNKRLVTVISISWLLQEANVKYDNNSDWGVTREKSTYIADLNDIDLIQDTGRKDKNGREIYEGDILGYVSSRCEFCGTEKVYPNHKPYPVFWDEEECCFKAENDENWMSPEVWGTDMEVIGNIYENPV